MSSSSLQCKLHAAMTAKVDPSAAFPAMLHRMLTDIDEMAKNDPGMENLKQIVSWQPHGKAFKVHDRKKFAEVVMPTWFTRIKHSSWIRQLSLFGFQKVHEEGPDKGAMYHKSFVRGMPELVKDIHKVKKGRTPRTKTTPSPSSVRAVMNLPSTSSSLAPSEPVASALISVQSSMPSNEQSNKEQRQPWANPNSLRELLRAPGISTMNHTDDWTEGTFNVIPNYQPSHHFQQDYCSVSNEEDPLASASFWQVWGAVDSSSYDPTPVSYNRSMMQSHYQQQQQQCARNPLTWDDADLEPLPI